MNIKLSSSLSSLNTDSEISREIKDQDNLGSNLRSHGYLNGKKVEEATTSSSHEQLLEASRKTPSQNSFPGAESDGEIDHVVTSISQARDAFALKDQKKKNFSQDNHLSSMLFRNYLRSPALKKEEYRTAYNEKLDSLLRGSTQDDNGDLPQNIEEINTWNEAVKKWANATSGSIEKISDPIAGTTSSLKNLVGGEEKERFYNELKELAANMPAELSELVSLTQAMKVMDDAMVYQSCVPPQFNKAAIKEKNRLLSKMDAINKNLLQYETVANDIIKFYKAKKECEEAEAVTRSAGNPESANGFSAAAEQSQQAIELLLQFSQKLKEGDAPGARLDRLEGLRAGYSALIKQYNAASSQWNALGQQAAAQNNRIRKELCDQTAKAYRHAADIFQGVQEPENKGRIAEILISAGKHCLQQAEALTQGNTAKGEDSSNVKNAYWVAAHAIKKAQQQENAATVAELYNKAGDLYLQRAVALEKGDTTSGEKFGDEAKNYNRLAGLALRNAQEPKSTARAAKDNNQKSRYMPRMAERLERFRKFMFSSK